MKSKQTKSLGVVREFDPARVRPLPGQPRKRFRGISELAASIEEVGQATPGLVTLVEGDEAFDAQLVDGERRLRACQVLRRPFRAEVVAAAADPEETFVASFAANFGRQDHDVMEVAEGLDRMRKAGKTLEQLARIAGKSVSWVHMHLNLLKLHPKVQKMMVPSAEGEREKAPLTLSLGQLLVPLNEAEQIRLAEEIVEQEGQLTMSGARRMILKARAAAGDREAYTPSGGRKRTILTLEGIFEDLENRVGVYLDMPGDELRDLVDAVDHRAKRELMEQIDDVVGSLEGLKAAIGKRLPVAGRRGN